MMQKQNACVVFLVCFRKLLFFFCLRQVSCVLMTCPVCNDTKAERMRGIFSLFQKIIIFLFFTPLSCVLMTCPVCNDAKAERLRGIFSLFQKVIFSFDAN